MRYLYAMDRYEQAIGFRLDLRMDERYDERA